MTSNHESLGPEDSQAQLGQAKQRVREMYLGKFGIHGVGVRRSENAVRIYASAGHGDQQVCDQQACFDQIGKEIAPCKLDVVFEDAPSIQASADRDDSSESK